MPDNDDFASRVLVGGSEIRTNGSNVGASSQAGEQPLGFNAGGHTVWWSWTATFSGPVLIDTLVSRFDTILAVYTGDSLHELELVAQNDDAGTKLSRVEFDAEMGTTYAIAVDGYGSSVGEAQLRITRSIRRVPQDFPSINEALNSAEDGDTIVVAPGEYREHVDFRPIDARLPVCRDVALVSSHGPYVTSIAPNYGKASVTIAQCDERTVLSGFTVSKSRRHYGNRLVTSTDAAGIELLSSSGSAIHGNVIEGNTVEGISNTHVVFSPGAGIYIAGSTATVFDNRILHNVTPHYGGGIKVYARTSKVEIIGNEVAYNEAGSELEPGEFAGGGIHIDVNGDVRYQDSALEVDVPGNVRVADNWVHSNVNGGMAVYTGLRSTPSLPRLNRAVVTQNLIEGNERAPALWWSADVSAQIIGNTVDASGAGNAALEGPTGAMAHRDARPPRISGNIIRTDDGQPALRCTVAPEDAGATIVLNVLTDSQQDPTPGCG